MNRNRRETTRVQEGDDGSGRIALFGLLLVLSLLIAAVRAL
ncbi:MAG: hypothetical protein WD825_13410 [Gemmatimonadaceae bacterium]